MAASFHPPVSLTRYLVDAEELALAVERDAEALAAISNGRVTAETAREIRERLAAIRRIEQQRRAPRATPPTTLAREACQRAARIAGVALHAAKLHGDERLLLRLAELRRDHPLRARAISVVACSLEAYATVIQLHASTLAAAVDEGCAETLQATARELRTRAAERRQQSLRARERTAERDRLVGEIEARVRDVRAARALHLCCSGPAQRTDDFHLRGIVRS